MSDSLPMLKRSACALRELFAQTPEKLTGFYKEFSEHLRTADNSIGAFVSVDERVVDRQVQHLLAANPQAVSSSARPSERLSDQPLYGVPVAIKDIIDTADFPTGHGSPIYQGRFAASDATVVRRLRDAGAVIVGKTVTTEFATFVPGATRNPHNHEHTPGGSSSGSAAAVAAGMVPVAIGTQTNGSVLRPASFCGVYGFKPSFGVLPRTGVFEQSPSLDQLGVFARSLDDVALLTEIMSGDDGVDRGAMGIGPRRLVDLAVSPPPVTPRFCFVKTPWWDQIDPDAQTAYLEFLAQLDDLVTMVDMPDGIEAAVQWHSDVNEVELAHALQKELEFSPEGLSDTLRARIVQGATIPVLDYLTGTRQMRHVRAAFDSYFEHFDAILCPAALGGAPKGLASTGNPIMQTVWTFAGLPSLSMPFITLPNGLPLGVQAVGAYMNDGRLLRSARWLSEQVL
jgi:Asp-tRNA(Asn)/Glu-tRNA(Gln) amidotransferase A subunit family amidase